MEAKAELLVAEDSPTQAAQIQLLLEEAGYAVRLARNGKLAVEAVDHHPPDLVITDLEMPEMNGLEVVKALQQSHPGVPVILITARGSEVVASQALQQGAASYVPKQNLDSDLIATIERIVAVLKAQRSSERLSRYLTCAEWEYQLENDISLVPLLIARLQDNLRQLQVCDEVGLMQVGTALDEAIVNAIVHGNLEVPSELRNIENGRPYTRQIEERRRQAPFSTRQVTVSIKAKRTQVEFVIHDEGPGFDVTDVPDPTDPENLTRIGGRGLLLINAFMDEVCHNEQGNEIRMLKRRLEIAAAVP